MRKIRVGLCLLCKESVYAVLFDDVDEVDYIETYMGCKHTVMVEEEPCDEDEELTEDEDIEDDLEE